MGQAILLSDAISIEDFLSFQNCHRHRQRHVFTVGLPVETPLNLVFKTQSINHLAYLLL